MNPEQPCLFPSVPQDRLELVQAEVTVIASGTQVITLGLLCSNMKKRRLPGARPHLPDHLTL